MRTLTLSLLALILALPSAQADEYALDASHSGVVFQIKHVNIAPFYGMFRKISGSLSWGDDLSKNKISVTVDSASVFSNNQKRDAHIKSGDFLDAARYPQLTFVSTKIESKDGKTMVTGDLTCRGVTKSVSFPIEITGKGQDPWGKHRIGAHATITFKRSEFGIKAMMDKLGDEVTLMIAIQGVKK